ncbi:hypothetical protein ACFY36_50575 [Actinoplanes sp. NPDC000266]
MTVPAEITTSHDWNQLLAALAAQYRQIDGLYQLITAPEPETDETTNDLEEEPVSGPHPEYDLDRDAEIEDANRVRLDAETDGRLDGDYDPDPDPNSGGDPDLEP